MKKSYTSFGSYFLALILLTLLLSTVVSAQVLKGYVNDNANVLSLQDEKEISLILESLQKQGIAEFSILIISSLDGIPIEKYAFDVANENLGSKDKNNGLLLLISIEDRAYRFEVGRGLESVLNDAKVGRVGREILVPAFKEKNYTQGIKGSVGAIYGLLGADPQLGGREASYQTYNLSNNDSNLKMTDLYYYLFLFLVFLFFITGKRGSKRRLIGAFILGSMIRGGRGGRGRGGFGGGGFGGGGAGGKW